MFKIKYLDYLRILSRNNVDINSIINSPQLYTDLQKEAYDVYNKILNKEEWIKAEILSLLKNINIPIELDPDFKNQYRESYLRFDLIDDYLKKQNLIIDITNELNEVYNFFIENGKLLNNFRFLFMMITNSTATDKTFHFIEKLLNVYYDNRIEYQDNTMVYEISSFLEMNFTEQKVHSLKDQYPDIPL
ncbi:hypothetical protein [Chryseobacterium paludis]|uniref:hypothetical protein n=1 Tax=Chryseobacterium paludis TaxID=2956784 RepID=UPI0021C08151|nr:hypothetical protein [Chryseobacterium paludis]